ncbi:MAG: Ku protein [Burkholderiales bacterium]|nr:Ku protein [Burkholderiales bacterium]
MKPKKSAKRRSTPSEVGNPRVVWKGAISFGLVHIPVTLTAGARSNALDFDWLDRRDMSPVGYSRINKRTGKPIDNDDVVKGYQYDKGEYVLMSPEDFRQANVAATQTVEILAFVDAAEIPPYYFETPYYLEPDRRGEKGYALLRETLRRSGRAGLATVVIHTKQHLAALLVSGSALILNTMRYADEIRPTDALDLPDDDLKAIGLSSREVAMAERLVDEMTEPWAPERYRDVYRDDLMARIESKIDAGHTHLLTPPGREPARTGTGGAEIIDLMALLKKSIRGSDNAGATDAAKPATRRAAATKPAASAGKRATATRKPAEKPVPPARTAARPRRRA